MSHPDPQFDPADMTDADYRALPRLSYSGLKHLAVSPAHYKYFQENPIEQTDAMARGTQIHCAVLEPDLFKSRYVPVPHELMAPCGTKTINKNRKDWIAFVEEIEKRGQQVIMSGVIDAANAAYAAMKEDLIGGVSELVTTWEDEHTGVKCKGKIDLLTSSGVLIDLKTTSEPIDPESWSRKVRNDRLNWQGFFYSTGIERARNFKPQKFVHVVIETKPPYGVRRYRVSDAAMDRAALDVNPLIRLYADCLARNEWPGYPAEEILSDLPPWDYAVDPDLLAAGG